MIRRRVIFTDSVSGLTYVTPEFNGDKQEFEQFIGENGDKCTATWAEIAEVFRPVRTLEEFKAANEAAQRCYMSAVAPKAKPLPARQLPDIAGLNADEIMFLPASDGVCSFTDREFKAKMLRADSDTLVDFIGRDILVADGDEVSVIDVESEIDAVFAQMPVEEIEKYWLLMLDDEGENDGK